MIARNRLVLPDPLGPTIVTISPRFDLEADIVQDALRAIGDVEMLDRDEAHAPAFSAQAGQTPSASTTARSIWNPAARAASPNAPLAGADCASATASQRRQIMKAGEMRLSGMGAGDEGVQPLDLVNEAMLDEEIERPVGHRRLRSESRLVQQVEHGIGAKRTVFLQQKFQRLAAHRRQAQPLGRAARIGGGEGLIDTGAVIVLFEPKRRRMIGRRGGDIACHVISYHICGHWCYKIT